MSRAIVIAASVILLSSSARAEEPKPTWSVALRAGNVWMGPTERQTGGALVGIEAGHSWHLGERVAFDALLGIDGHGFVGGAHYMGLWAGPAVGVTWQTPADWLAVGAVVRAQYGRATVCTDWGYPVRFWGLFPEFDLRAGIGTPSLQAVADVSVVYVDTLAWSGPAWQGRLGGRFAFGR